MPIVAENSPSEVPIASGTFPPNRRAVEIAVSAAMSAVAYSSGLDSPRTSAARQHPASV